MIVGWSEEAEAQLAAIIQRYDGLSAGDGQKIAKAIYRAVARLDQFPESGREVPEFESPFARELIVGDFRVLYEPFPDRVEVFGVLSARMDLRPDG